MPSLSDLSHWLTTEENDNAVWYVKRLTGNDTLANETHQAGPYIRREFIFEVFPSVHQPDQENPDKRFELRTDSHGEHTSARVVWYNNKLRGGTRNETRITNLGGAASALLNPDSTGALTVFSFRRDAAGETTHCRAWVCTTAAEEDLVEERIGVVEPGEAREWRPSPEVPLPPPVRSTCWLDRSELPPEWLDAFPSGRDIIRKSIELKNWNALPIDKKLIARRDCEYELFKSVEHAFELRHIENGFTTIDDFVRRALTILQRRKSRSGRSLELHVREIFREEGLRENVDFHYQPETENGERPDFLFPSEAAYRDPDFPAEKLRMLGIKTTLKDRWAQILKEANRVETKHLLTLQEGISLSQFHALREANIKLVVPAPLFAAYHEDIRPQLITLESFIGEIRALNP